MRVPVVSSSLIEILEDRIAPASLVSHTTVLFTDSDGDHVLIRFTEPILTSAAVANSILHFSNGASVDGSSTPGQLQLIDLTSVQNAMYSGLGVSVTANRTHPRGDGYAAVGYIDAAGLDLGAVNIGGDLGRIDAGVAPQGGHASKTPAVRSLTVQSIGEFGAGTQESGGSLQSDFSGQVNSITVHGDVVNAYLRIVGEKNAATTAADHGALGSLTIGGSLIGSAGIDSGHVLVTGRLGQVTVGGDLAGGASNDTAFISADGAIGPVMVGGSVLGGGGASSGVIQSLVSIGDVTVMHDLRAGDAGPNVSLAQDSGTIDGGTSLGRVTIGGSVFGGGADSGSIRAESGNGTIAGVTIFGSLEGGPGEESAYIHAEIKLGPVVIGGSVEGGAGQHSAAIYAGGNALQKHIMTSVRIGGDLRGGAGVGSGVIGNNFATLGSAGELEIGSILIRGSVIGSAMDQSGSITGANVTSLRIGGSLIGSSGTDAGEIFIEQNAAAIRIGGSVTGDGIQSGSIYARSAGSITIHGDLTGGTGASSGSVNGNESLGSVTIGGSVRSGTAAYTGAIFTNGPLGSVSIGGSVIGTAAQPAEIIGGVVPKGLGPVIGQVSIGGSAAYLEVLGGFVNSDTNPASASVRIGPITVGHDWTASSVSAGIAPNAGGFGDSDDAPGPDTAGVLGRIASITIKGALFGTPATGDHFGFDAERIGVVQIGQVSYPALLGPGTRELGPNGDLTERVVAPGGTG